MKKQLQIFWWMIHFFAYINPSGPASLDTSYNTTGVTTNLFAAYTTNIANNIALQADNKLVAIGSSGDNAIIVRYNDNGSLDTTFNPTNNIPGVLTIILGTQSALYDVAIQPDNKIIVVGYALVNNINNAFIARFNPDGSPDTSFGGSNSGYILTIFQTSSQLYGIALQEDGSIVVTGWAIYTTTGQSNALLARYTSNGILDTTFNTVGYTTTLLGTTFTKAFDLALQNDGKIVIIGNAILNNKQELVVIRYTSSGALDTTFNGSGWCNPLDAYLISSGNAVIMQPLDQKIVVAGTTNLTQSGFSNQEFTLLRLNTDGTPDTTFNTTGCIISSIAIEATDLVIQTNGQIVVSGYDYNNEYIITINRFNTDGSMDPTFTYTTNTAVLNSLGNAIALEKNGKIIVAGTISIPFLAI